MVYENTGMLELNLECLRIMSGAENADIVIIDMGTDRDINLWLGKSEKMELYLCGGTGELC